MEPTKHYHIIDGLKESHMYTKDNRQILFKDDMIYLYKQFENYGWFGVATTTDQQLAIYWLETGELSRTLQYPYWLADYKERKIIK